MKLIVAVDEKWGIGKKNGLLFSLKGDMRYFREKTLDKVVVMGYNTLLSFPGGKPLKNRVNIVLAPDGVERDDCTICHTLEETFNEIEKYPTDDVFIIGGAMFYRTMYPYCKEAFITHVYKDGEAEVFFDDLSVKPNWEREDISDVLTEDGISYRFTKYVNDSPEKFK